MVVFLQYVDLDEFLSENGIPMDVPAPQQAPGLIGSTNMLPSPVTAPSPQHQQQPQQQPQLQQLHKLQVSSTKIKVFKQTKQNCEKNVFPCSFLKRENI